MRVLFQNRADALKRWGGDTTQMVETKKHLEELGLTIDINLEPEPDLKGYDIVHIFNIQTAEYGIRQLLNAKRNHLPVALSTIYWDMKHIIQGEDQYLYSSLRLVRSLAGINKFIPIILGKLYFWNSNRKKNYFAKTMLNEADILLPNSYSELEIIVQQFRMPELRAKALTVPNGVSDLILCSANPKKQGIKKDIFGNILPEEYVLEVASISIVKGQLKIIKALSNHSEIPLVFVGRGLSSYYGEECIKAGIKRGNTYFINEVSHEQICNYHKNAKVHVLPSLRESPGLASLEAAICGANCVVSFHSPVSEYFGFDAFCCNPCDINSIKDAILRAWNAPPNMNLKTRILSNFTWRNAALATLEAYNCIISGR